MRENSSHFDEMRAAAVGWYRLLRDYAKCRSKPKYDIEQYEDHVWLGDFPIADDCFTLIQQDGIATERVDEGIWIEIRKRDRPARPDPPFDPRWLADSDSNDDRTPPLLRDQINEFNTDSAMGAGTTRLLIDHPEIQSAWNEWVRNEWTAWAEAHRSWLAHHEVYSALFRIERALQRAGESLQLVLGVGLLSWKIHEKQPIRRHLLTIPVEIVFQKEGGVFQVGPTSEQAQWTQEVEMIERERLRLDVDTIEEEHRLALDEELWKLEEISKWLRALLNSFSDEGALSDAIEPGTSEGDRPAVRLAPALILRPRPSAGMEQRFEAVASQIEAGGEIPENVRLLSDARPSASAASESPVSHGDEQFTTTLEPATVLFPLPWNDEQMQIVDRLIRRNGLLVKGPPGTGKTHTIANLICHLLAHGKRVLITAQTPRALRVLREKLPKEIQPLCLSLLGNDRSSLSELEGSVTAIVSRQERQRDGDSRRITALEQELDAAIKRTAETTGCSASSARPKLCQFRSWMAPTRVRHKPSESAFVKKQSSLIGWMTIARLTLHARANRLSCRSC